MVCKNGKEHLRGRDCVRYGDGNYNNKIDVWINAVLCKCLIHDDCFDDIPGKYEGDPPALYQLAMFLRFKPTGYLHTGQSTGDILFTGKFKLSPVPFIYCGEAFPALKRRD
jgi:hypothetical protein